jgi:hypothetical protein
MEMLRSTFQSADTGSRDEAEFGQESNASMRRSDTGCSPEVAMKETVYGFAPQIVRDGRTACFQLEASLLGKSEVVWQRKTWQLQPYARPFDDSNLVRQVHRDVVWPEPTLGQSMQRFPPN